jgi:hypothetical protein
MDAHGIINVFLINIFNRIGEVGRTVVIGKEKESGTLKIINLLHHKRDRN